MKISFCTTCMDRLFHLKETYIKSIRNTASYQNKEFILLNYNSKDDLDNWIYENTRDLIKYYKTTDVNHWFAAHAKNICHRLATGDILVNLDADNVIAEGYCEYLINLFNKNVIVASESDDLDGNHGCCGLISSRKNHFYSVNGYDESFNIGWGLDDTNYQFRCRMHNNLELVIQDRKYNKCISHSNELRSKNCINKNTFFTEGVSKNNLNRIALEKDYVANKNIHWGKAKLLYNFAYELEI